MEKKKRIKFSEFLQQQQHQHKLRLTLRCL